MKKKVLSILLCVTMLVSLLPATAFAAEAEVYVGRVILNSSNQYWKNDGTQGTEDDYNAKFDATNNLLYLKSAIIEGADVAAGAFGTSNLGIYSAGALNIILEDDNNVIKAGKFGIVSSGDMRIFGEGSLDITQGTSTTYGLYGLGSITVEDASVQINTTNTSLYANTDAFINNATLQVNTTGSYGIHAKNSMQLVNANVTAVAVTYGVYAQTGEVSIAGGSVSAEGTGNTGVYAATNVTISNNANVTATGSEQGVYAAGADVSIQASELTTAGATYGVRAKNNVSIISGEIDATGVAYGLFAHTGAVSITGGNIKATGTGTDGAGIYSGTETKILEEAEVTVASSTNGSGVWSAGGDVSISNSKFTSTGATYGVRATNNVSIIGGEIDTTGAAYGLFANSGAITISGGKVTATGTNNAGIYSHAGDVTIKEEASVKSVGTLYGVYGVNGVTINNSTVDATGTTGAGIYNKSESGTVKIKDSSVEAKGNGTTTNGHGIYGGTVDFTNSRIVSTVNGGAETGYGVYSFNGDLTMTSSWVQASAKKYSMVAKGEIHVVDSQSPDGFQPATHPTDDTLSCFWDLVEEETLSPEDFPVITFSDFNVDDGTYTNGTNGNGWYPIETTYGDGFQNKTFAGIINFSKANSGTYFLFMGEGITKGIKLHVENEEAMIFQAYGVEDASFEPVIINFSELKKSPVGNDVLFKISVEVTDVDYDGEKDDVRFWLYFDGELYKNQTITAVDYAKHLGNSLVVCSATTNSVSIKSYEEPPKFEEITFRDFGVKDGAYTFNNNYYPVNATYDEGFTNKTFVGTINFSAALTNTEIHLTGTDNTNGVRLYVQSDNSIVFQNVGSTPATFSTVVIQATDVPKAPIGQDVEFKMSVEVADIDGDGTSTDVRFWLFFDGELYQSKPIEAINHAQYLGNNLTILTGSASHSVAIKSASLKAPTFDEITFSNFGVQNDTYTFEEGVYYPINATYEEGFENKTFVGTINFSDDLTNTEFHFTGTDNTNGVRLYMYPGNLIVFQVVGSTPVTFSQVVIQPTEVPNVPVGKDVEFKMSVEVADADLDGEKDDVRFWLFFDGELYQNKPIEAINHAQYLGNNLTILTGSATHSVSIKSKVAEVAPVDSTVAWTYIKPEIIYIRYTAEDFATYREGEYTAPTFATPYEKAGMVFAGWFADTNDDTPIKAEKSTVSVYAKFVPAEILTVKARFSKPIDETTNRHIQFATTIAGLRIKEVGLTGFYQKGDVQKNFASQDNTTVYKTLQSEDVEGNVVMQYPKIFSFASTHFKTYTVRNIPESGFSTEFNVTPYWITLDGTRVTGTSAIKSINQGLGLE